MLRLGTSFDSHTEICDRGRRVSVSLLPITVSSDRDGELLLRREVGVEKETGTDKVHDGGSRPRRTMFPLRGLEGFEGK